MKYDYWETDWLRCSECTTENFTNFIVRHEHGVKASEHRKRLKTILYASYEYYLAMPRVLTHLSYEEEVQAASLWLSQPNPVLMTGENIYQRFIRKVRDNMIAKARRRASARHLKEKKEQQLQLFLNDCSAKHQVI